MDYLTSVIDAPSYVARAELVQYVDTQSRFLPIRLTVNDNNKYAQLVNSNDSNIYYLLDHIEDDQVKNAGQLELIQQDTISVNDCVLKGQDVLGLKINEIARLLGVSRATLDLHRKGANVKDMTAYHSLYSFVSSVETLYGNSIKNGVRNVLVERKTLIQHLVINSDNLSVVMPLVAEVSEKVRGMRIIKSDMDASKTNIRLSGIGRMA
ncbi:hypothetical protein C9I43_01380 [Shewanella morhuae]|uniref:HTH cro/C1-type domain-containing protein n=1 Tax=Shewanella morhuae TaxID=365591 RepID=A0ABX5HT20_9GAMM|nr:hypothetical protein [Shewanella morhuae]PTA49272.1 hypothetical protein C9I43_01380 [Shewanella morhuae]